MQRKYFGTDGIRGTVGQPPITADFMLRLGHAVGRVLRREHRHATVLVGKDTRISGYMIEAALEAGFSSAGVDVTMTGPVPTPGIAYLTQALRASLGVVISASHNPYHDNGIKFFSSRGEKLPDQWERDVEAALDEPAAWAESQALGKVRRLEDARGRYIEFCKSTSPGISSLAGLKVVVDAANGAAWDVVPHVMRELGADVVPIGCSPDGRNINAGCGATAPSAMVSAVIEHQADYGIALDGDADRLVLADGGGRLYNGDELLYVLVLDRLSRAERVPGVVGTLMTNMAIEQALRRLDVPLVRAKVGDRYVLEELTARGWTLGGEGSGHLLALDRHTTGDGIISALQILQAVMASGRSLAEMLEGVTLFPQTLLNVKIDAASGWRESPALKSTLREVEAGLGDRGRVLIRPSGTEPVVRVMVEAADAAQAREGARRLAEAIAA